VAESSGAAAAGSAHRAQPLSPVPLARAGGRCRPAGKSAYPGAVSAILGWWDGVELWLSDLPFVLQTTVVMPVVLALAYGTAILLDGALAQAARLLRRARHGEQNGDQ
jgi:hypothetical protein